MVGRDEGVQDPWGWNQEEAGQGSPPDILTLAIVIGEETKDGGKQAQTLESIMCCLENQRIRWGHLRPLCL